MNWVLTPEASREVGDLPRPIQARLWRLLERLTHWPDVSGAKPLRGNLAGHYRLRTSDYLVQFRVSGRTVIIEKIGHRDGFCEE